MAEQAQHSPELRQVTTAWKCDRCSSTFQRLDHLQRHQSTRTLHPGTKEMRAEKIPQMIPQKIMSARFVALHLVDGV